MPQNWKTYKLEDIASIRSGKRLPKGHELTSTQTEYRYIRLVNIDGNSIQQDNMLFLEPETQKLIARYIVNETDVCLAIVGHTIGLVFYVDKEYEGVNLTENAARLTDFREDIDSKFIYYSLLSPQGYHNILSRKVGSAQGKLPLYNIRSLELQIPPLPEQKAIASILSSLDDKIELNLQMNRTLEEMAMTLYKHWFVDFGPFKDGNFIDSELGPIPEGWEVNKMGEMLEVKYGKDHKKLDEGNIPVYGSGGIMRYVDTFLYDQDSILIPRKGTLSNLFYLRTPFWSVDTMFFTKLNDQKYGKYIFYFLKTQDLASMDVGSAVPSLTTELLKKLPILIPPHDMILSFDEDLSRFFDTMEFNIKENQTLTNLRDTLLPKLISGEVRVKDVEQTLADAL